MADGDYESVLAMTGAAPMAAAAGVRPVPRDHMTTPNVSTCFAPDWSAHCPPTSCVVEYPAKKAESTMPSNV